MAGWGSQQAEPFLTVKQDSGGIIQFMIRGERSEVSAKAKNPLLFNHSSQPNAACYREDGTTGSELIIHALRDIRKDEELFYIYRDDC
jgi:hypothetical protein